MELNEDKGKDPQIVMGASSQPKTEGKVFVEKKNRDSKGFPESRHSYRPGNPEKKNSERVRTR